MTRFLQNLLTASLQGSVVIAAVLLLRLILRKAPRKYICLLWLLAGLRLLLPVQIKSELSLQPVLTPVLPQWDIVAVLPWLWLAVAACFGIYSIVSYTRLKKQVREAVRIRGGWESDKIDTAFILGFIKPRIYIPMGMSKQSRKYILEHERTHLDKGDHWIKMIGFLALALHWFNPLVWVAYILLCRDIEMACDERVVQFMELEERKGYSAALLSCSSRQLHFAASPVAFGEVSVKQRILSILNYKKPSFWAGLAAVLAIGFVILCLLTTAPEAVEPVIVEVPASAYKENTPEEIETTVSRLENAWNAILSAEKYHLFFADESYEGGVGWQVNCYKLGEDTIWRATDHSTEEGHMVLGDTHYKFIDGIDSGWVACEEADTMLDTLLAYFDLTGKALTDISSEVRTNEAEYTYEALSYVAHSHDEAGNPVAQPVTVYFDMDGTMTGMRLENTDRPGVDIFSFTNFGDNAMFNGIEDVYRIAQENILPAERVHPSMLQSPTEDEQLMKEWGILFRVDDDLLTQYGSEVWFAQADGYDMIIHTNNEYWLERRTDTGWEKLEILTEPEWASANYTLGHGMYTMTFVDWSELYGPLPGGIYRMGKYFEKVNNGSRKCIGYAEFEIFHNEASTEEQTAAVERCYAELEELTKRENLHWLSIMGVDSRMEYWVSGDNYLRTSQWNGPEAPYEEWSEHDKSLFPRVDTAIRYNGVGYGEVREDPEVPSSKVLGIGLSTLDPNRAGWTMGTISEDFNFSFFERGNKNILFPEGIGVVSDRMVRFVESWNNVDDPNAYEAQLTYKFDEDGNICYMEYRTEGRNGRDYVASIEIFDDTAEEIDAKIRPMTENLVVNPFSWEEAKAKYTDEEFNIRQDSFVNTEVNPIQDAVDAARRAMKEYPNLGEYLSVEVFHDDTAGMWKVTIKAYVEYQSTDCYRDIYLADNGVTCLLVYEGPIGYNETRK